MSKRLSAFGLALLTAGWFAACAQPEQAEEAGAAAEESEAVEVDEDATTVGPDLTGTTEVIVAKRDDIAFQDGPPSLPVGARFAVIEGDPGEAEPLTFRLRFPAGYEIPPHYHHVLEHVTVISGTLHVGMGETMDKTQGTALGPGDFGVIPVEMTHYAWTEDQPVEFQLHSVGPWGITYVNPDDDPRSGAATASAAGGS